MIPMIPKSAEALADEERVAAILQMLGVRKAVGLDNVAVSVEGVLAHCFVIVVAIEHGTIACVKLGKNSCIFRVPLIDLYHLDDYVSAVHQMIAEKYTAAGRLN